MEHTDKEDVERACMRENKRKFTETENTPCMTAPLCDDIGFTDDSIACNRILQSTYIPSPGTSPYVVEFINELQNHPFTGPSPPTTIQTDDFINFWMKKKEQVSAGISGIHYRHMKACAQD